MTRGSERTGRVLVVDVDAAIVEVMVTGLRHAGHEVVGVRSGPAALTAAASFVPQVVVFDPALPDLDGFTTLDRLRGPGSVVPVLLVTPSDDTRDAATEPDAVLLKPFAMGELTARVGGLLSHTQASSTGPGGGHRVQVEDVVLDPVSGRVWRGGQQLLVSPTEVTLLRCLLDRAGQLVPVAELLTQVSWGPLPGAAAIVASYLEGLARQLNRAGPPLIHRVADNGYRFGRP